MSLPSSAPIPSVFLGGTPSLVPGASSSPAPALAPVAPVAPVAGPRDPLAILREYRALAPWGLRDLSAVAGGILDASGVVPINAAARARPSERTIRFYVAQGLVSPPEGRGTAAIYTYRHLLQVLAIKLRQMEGATLEQITQELKALTGDTIERRVAASLGVGIPLPGQLQLVHEPGMARGKVGRAVQAWLAPPEAAGGAESVCRRILVGPGVELLVDEQHPAMRLGGGPAIAEAVRRALAEVVNERAPHMLR
ncbi:MAG TPA: MerR family transcriptional regulator [Gemmatimonadales bacterium]|nr:MerR family transcriptional regulator [Gemmatimonadales bacterium]